MFFAGIAQYLQKRAGKKLVNFLAEKTLASACITLPIWGVILDFRFLIFDGKAEAKAMGKASKTGRNGTDGTDIARAWAWHADRTAMAAMAKGKSGLDPDGFRGRRNWPHRISGPVWAGEADDFTSIIRVF